MRPLLHVALAKELEEAAGVLVERGAKVTAKDKVIIASPSRFDVVCF